MNAGYFETEQAQIGIEDVLIYCPNCGKMSIAEMTVIGRYYQYLLIPIFPYDKIANVTCKECGLKRYELRYKFSELKGNFRYPWYMYIGGTIFAVCIILIIIITYFNN